jgi:DNA-binding transcriptional LysR family regulator
VRLLSRTTRAVVPTEAGGEFLARIEPILAALDDAEHSVREGGELHGLLRMSMPTSFGIRDVIPRLASFAQRHPNLHIQLQLGDRRQDLIKDAVDAAIRLGRLPDSTATAKLIATIPRVVVASPEYLAREGTPGTPDELVRHRIVGGTAAAVPTAWRFEREGQESAIKLEPHFSTDENEGAIAAAAAGFGITSTVAGRAGVNWTMARLFDCCRSGNWPAFRSMPTFRWGGRRAPRHVLPSTTSPPHFSATPRASPSNGVRTGS